MDKWKDNIEVPHLESAPLPLWLENTAWPFDPFGSYTGRCIDPEEKPIQDADDL